MKLKLPAFLRLPPKTKPGVPSQPAPEGVRNLAGVSPNQVYLLMLKETSLPDSILGPMQAPLIEIGCSLQPETIPDVYGAFDCQLLTTPERRIALVYIESDIIQQAFERIPDLVSRVCAARVCEALFLVTSARTIPAAQREQRNLWCQGLVQQVIFCEQPEIQRFQAADPAKRKSILREWFDIRQVESDSVTPPTGAVALDKEARSMLISTLTSSGDKQIVKAGYFDRLLTDSGVSGDWVNALKMAFSRSSEQNAQLLIDRAALQGSFGAPAGYTILGWILETALPTLPTRLQQANVVSVMILGKLLTGAAQVESLSTRYMVPRFQNDMVTAQEIGPDIDWAGPGEDLELQSYEVAPRFLNFDDLAKCLEQQGSICLISVPSIQDRKGTGFLVAPNLVLTNCHVLLADWRIPEDRQAAEVKKNAVGVSLRFRYTGAEKENASAGKTFSLTGESPVVKFSPVGNLDYALLRVDGEITNDKGLGPAACWPGIPAIRSPLHIVQHPKGEALQVDFNMNGVTNVDENKGLLQYVTRTAPGSSGSPCFNEKWEVVGLHHAERPRYNFWSIREGILIRSILEEIKVELDRETGPERNLA